MDWVKVVISAIAALSVSLILPTLKGISEPRATGIGLNLGGFFERLHSSESWALAALLFALLLATSRLRNRVFRALLFWAPASLSVMLGLRIAAAFAYAYLSFRTR